MKTAKVAVVGGGIGGLTAAGLLARAGHQVTLFEAGATLGGKAQRWKHEGLQLDTGPTLLTLPAVVQETFSLLGAIDLLPAFVELKHQCRYHYADGRSFNTYADLAATQASAQALGAKEGEALGRFYQEAAAIYAAAGEPYLEGPFEGMPAFMAQVSRRGLGAVALGLRLGTLDGLARRHFRSEALRQFVGRFATYVGASPYEASAAFALIAHVERVYGVHHVQGGMGALVDSLAQALERAGVEVQLNTPAEVKTEGQGFRVGPVAEATFFDSVVVNADPLASLQRKSEVLALSGYVLLASVEGKAALPHHSVRFSEDSRAEFQALFAGKIPSDATVYCCYPARSDAAMASSEQSGLYLMVNAPALPQDAAGQEEATRAWEQHVWGLQEQMLGKLYGLRPDLKGRVKVRAQRTPVDFAAQGAPGGSIYGVVPHGKLGPFRRPRMRGPRPGWFYAGGGTHPGGGVPMVMLSGRFAAQLADAHLKARA